MYLELISTDQISLGSYRMPSEIIALYFRQSEFHNS